MDSQKEKHASRVGRALSWIAGAEVPTMRANDAGQATHNSQRNRIQKNRRPHSLLFSTSDSTKQATHTRTSPNNVRSGNSTLEIHDNSESGALDNSITRSPTSGVRMRSAWTAIRGGGLLLLGGTERRNVDPSLNAGRTSEQGQERKRVMVGEGEEEEHAQSARPPPFFHSRPLSTLLGGMTMGVTHTGDVSINSVDSSEIASWKANANKRTSGQSLEPPRRGRFESLKSLLSIQRTISTSIDKEEEETSPVVPDVSLVETWTPIVPSRPPTIFDYPPATPALTLASRSRSRSTVSQPQGLSPPPRPKRQLSQRSKSSRQPRGHSIDPAKWAEISISAADLIAQFGDGKLLFYPSPPATFTARDSFEVQSVSSDGTRTIGEESLIELPDECTPLRPSSRNVLADRMQDKDIDISRSSMGTASMISFSKWPLPPQCDRFDAAVRV